MYTRLMPKFACPFCTKTFDDTQKRGSHISSGHRGPDRDRYLQLPHAERLKKAIVLPDPGPVKKAPADSPSALDAQIKERAARLRIALAKLNQERDRLQAQLEILESVTEDSNGGPPKA